MSIWLMGLIVLNIFQHSPASSTALEHYNSTSKTKYNRQTQYAFMENSVHETANEIFQQLVKNAFGLMTETIFHVWTTNNI